MKTLIKNLILFSILTFVLLTFVGCPSGTQNDYKSEKSTDKADEDKSDDKEYPPAPEAIAKAEFEVVNGETFKLNENKGKVVLFNLWAVWCGPCIHEMPHLNEMHEKFNDDGLVIVGVNTGNDAGEKETVPNIEKFVKRQKLKYTIAQTDREAINAFFLTGQRGGIIPQSFLFDRKGRLRGIFQGGSQKVITQMKEVVENVVNEK